MVQCSDSFAAENAAAKLRLDHSGGLLHAWGLLDPRESRIALGALRAHWAWGREGEGPLDCRGSVVLGAHEALTGRMSKVPRDTGCHAHEKRLPARGGRQP